MTNEMNAKINFRKIATLSILVGLAIFLIKNIITYIIFRKTGIDIFIALGLGGVTLVAYSIFYYYIHALIAFSIFVYIRGSLPDDYKKAGLIFAFISFLFGNTIYSVLKFAIDNLPASTFTFGEPIVFHASEMISSTISILFIGFIVSYVFERFYKK